MPTPAHFIFIPGVLLIGIVIGWILGSRAAADAYASQMRKQRDRESRAAGATTPNPATPNPATPDAQQPDARRSKPGA